MNLKKFFAIAMLVCSASIANAQKGAFIDFTTDNNSSNYVTLTNTSNENYNKVTWDLGDGRVKNFTESTNKVYYPFKGEYVITLIGESDGLECKRTRKVVIANDDPNYGSNLELVWSDEFEGETVNREDWTFETGANGWGNNELQDYTDGANAELKNGKLIISARRTDERPTVKRGKVTSTRMITKDKQEFLYGRIEMRAKMPKGRGLWAAFWMLGANFPETSWPHCGEIDIMEYVGYDKDVQNVAMHNGSSSGNTRHKGKATIKGMESKFHTYGIVWDKYCVKFYVDDVNNVIYTYTPDKYDNAHWPYGKPHFILLNLAVGGNWGGKEGVDPDIFPADYVIDYVRVYQHPEYK